MVTLKRFGAGSLSLRGENEADAREILFGVDAVASEFTEYSEHSIMTAVRREVCHPLSLKK